MKVKCPNCKCCIDTKTGEVTFGKTKPKGNQTLKGVKKDEKTGRFKSDKTKKESSPKKEKEVNKDPKPEKKKTSWFDDL